MSDQLDFLDKESFAEQSKGTVLELLMEPVNVMIQLGKDVDEAEAKLAELKKSYKTLADTVIPDILTQNGVYEIKMENVTISLKEMVEASIPKDEEKRARVFKFLAEKGAAHLIKDVLTVEDPSESFVQTLKDSGAVFSRDKNVNGNSLKAWLRDKLGINKGSVQELTKEDFPQEMSVYPHFTTKIS